MAPLTLDQIARDNENLEPASTNSLHLSHRVLSDVFNAGRNKLRKIDEISSALSLRALILNDNKISSICKLDQLKYLNTLVLSKNPIYDIGDSLMMAKSLTKLSLSHCHLEKIGSSLTSCVELKELRLAHSKIATISAELARNSRLLNLDLGNDLIENWSELKVKQFVPNLRIFNAKPVETSKKSKRFSKEDFLSKKSKKFSKEDNLSKIVPPLHNASDIEAEEEVKKKKSKKDISTSYNDEIHVLPSLTNDEVGKKSKKAQLEKGTPSIADKKKDDRTGDTSLRTTKKSKSMEFASEEFPSLVEIDDVEAPCFDQSSDKNTRNADREKNDDRVIKLIEHKKRTKAKSTDLRELQLLTSNSEVGLGGPSTWDD